jgi:hypothetical protein
MKHNLHSLKHLFSAILLLALLGLPGVGWGQVNISVGTSYTQNFNGIGSTATATLPTGWRMENIAGARTVTTAYTSVANTATAIAHDYNVAMATNAGNGRYNFGGSSATDRAIGGLSSSSASQSVNMYLQLTNNGATGIDNFTINYDAERYRNGSNAAGFSIRVYYSTTGAASSWVEMTDCVASFTANGDNAGSTTNPMQTISITNKTLSQSLSAGNSIYFAWSYSVTTGTTTSNAQALGIDNISITANGGGTPLITVGSITGFGNQCINTTSSENTYSVSGSNLTDDITITPPAGFEISTTSGSGFVTNPNTLTILQTGGTASATIYVVFKPTATTAFNGNITHTSAGATQKDVAVSGTGTNTPPTVTTTTPATNIGSNTVTCSGNVTDAGCQSITARGICYGESANPDLTGSFTTETGTTGAFSSNLTGLNSASTYHFRAYATSSAGTSYGASQTFITLTPEPTNHVLAFTTGTVAHNSIQLTWTDATGGTLPHNYIIKGSTVDFNSITDPIDGTPEENGGLVRNVAQGVQAYSFTGLSPLTTYYFKIWPYTNSGTNINYKIDGTIPQASVSTPIMPWIEDFEIGNKTSYAAGNVTCSQGIWNMDNALLGTSASDRRNGSQSVRMQIGGSITMNFNKSGAGTITILHARYGSDAVGSWKLQISINDGESWTDVGSVVNTTTTTLTAQEFAINQVGNVRFKVVLLSGNRINIDDFTITNYTEPSTSTFTGTTSTTWELGLNWSNGTPGPGTDVIIPASKTVVVNSNDFECNNLTIAPLGALTINTGKDLLVNGDFLIQSDVTGTGSFIENGTLVADSYAVQRYIAGAAEAWHLLSSPVAAQAISGGFTPAGTYGDGSGYDFYAWSEPTETWLNQKVGANNITSFVRGKGYLVAYQAANPTKTFTGTLNEGIYYTAVTISGSGEYKNTNLVGNPFPSSIDWKSSPGIDKGDLVGYGEGGVSHYVWNESALNYGVYSDANEDDAGTNGASRYIAPMQGFFVVAAVAGDFGIDNDARVHSTQAWLKSGNDNAFRLRVNAPASYGSDELLLEFGHNSSVGGAQKWNSLVSTAPGLFTTKEDANLSISYLSSVSENPMIPVAFKAGIDGNYSLTADFNTASFSSVTLIDAKTSMTQNLNTNPVYSFNATTGDDLNRFTLHFGTLGIDNPATSSSISVYTHGETLYIGGLEAKAEISVINLTGQVVMSSRTNGSGLHSLNAAVLPKGVYVVSVISNGQAISRKVVL